MPDHTPEARAAETAQHHADALKTKADRMGEHANGMYGRFAGGQPLLVGHHSYRSAVRDRGRADNATRRSIEAQQDAERAQDRANRLRTEADTAATIERRSRPWQRSDFQPGDIITVLRSGTAYPLKYRVLRANTKTLTCDGEGFDNPKKPYDRIYSRTRDGITTTDPESD